MVVVEREMKSGYFDIFPQTRELVLFFVLLAVNSELGGS